MDIYFQLLWENTKQLDCWIDSQQSFKGPISKVEYALRRGKICILPFFILEWQFSQMLLTTNGWESVSFPWFCLATAKIGNGGLVLQLSFIRQATDNTPWGMRISWPQRRPSTHFGSLFLYACLPLPEPAPYQVGLARRGRGFSPGGSHSSGVRWVFPLFPFHGLFPPLAFSHCHFGLLSPILTT